MESDNILNKINLPEDLKNLSSKELDDLCKEIRKEIIEIVSKNGGHLASNLGVVELTVALHKVFNCPKDKIVFDVGHQCYAHKILTGRLDRINTIRKENGLAGFPRRNESEYDVFSTGHSSTSISSAFGLVRANNILDNDSKVVAVIGDGALSGGLAYEGLNNAGAFKKNFIVILNDNKMSISRNVGAVARYLAAMRTRRTYLKIKGIISSILGFIPLFGPFLKKFILRSKSALKKLLYKGTLFENMGFLYYGPIDGHNMKKLINVLSIAKNIDKPILIHVNTVKGKGYKFAEKSPNLYHGTSKFNIETGSRNVTAGNFSDVFGKKIFEMAKSDKRICAITAAMKMGTGLSYFSKCYKNRFFDVGIAEEHAVTFAGGLSLGGMIPFFAVYSTFLQRSYDQIIHDAALQNLKVILAIDRAGIVGEDGETHQGVFDVSFLNGIPNVNIFAPSFFCELETFMENCAYKENGVCAIRYPKGAELYKPLDFTPTFNDYDLYGDLSSDILLVTYGKIFSNACLAKEKLDKLNIKTCILKLNRLKPLPKEAVNLALNFKKVFFFEEGILNGGIGEHFIYELSKLGFDGYYKITAIDDKFVMQASIESTLKALNLDKDGIANTILGSEVVEGKEKTGYIIV